MKIALDYDDTYTQDPKLWDKFIELSLLRDHEIMIVTFRSPDVPIDHEPRIPVFYTSWRAKRGFMERQGIDIDVWIDDSPELIITDGAWSTDEIERWMSTQKASTPEV